MSDTAQTVINRTKLRLGDHEDDSLFSNDEYLEELKAYIVELVEDLECYVTESAIHLKEGEHVYDLPEDQLGLVAIVHDDFYNGRIILHSSYQNILSSGNLLTSGAFNSPQNWGFPTEAALRFSNRTSSRDAVSKNQIMISPAPEADEPIVYNEEVYS